MPSAVFIALMLVGPSKYPPETNNYNLANIMGLRIPIQLLGGKPVGYLQVAEDLALGLL